MCMLRIEAVSKNILKDVERVLRTEFLSNLTRTNGRDSHEPMGETFTYLAGRRKAGSGRRWRNATRIPRRRSTP